MSIQLNFNANRLYINIQTLKDSTIQKIFITGPRRVSIIDRRYALASPPVILSIKVYRGVDLPGPTSALVFHS